MHYVGKEKILLRYAAGFLRNLMAVVTMPAATQTK